MQLLVVDDEARIRELIKKYATFEHYDVTEAENGMQAVELCRKHSYDLIIMECDDAGPGRFFRLPRNTQA